MPITATDIKLLESERMADTTDGGGRRTNRIIPDGVAGNIFPKVSRLDAVYGRVNLRKVYGAVQTADVDTYAGAHVAITDAPDNDRIHVTLFSTANEFDTRTAARDRIESFVTSGPESRMTLLGRQLVGQQTFSAYQRETEALPELGDVYCLSDEVGTTVINQQYVRIQAVESELRTFEDDRGEFKRRVLTIEIGQPLRHEFNGPESASRYSSVERPSKVRATSFVDAARYFGIRPLALDAAENDLTIKVDSVYTQIVPTTNRETALANLSIGGAGGMLAIKAGTRTQTLTTTGWANNTVRNTLRGILPGSLNITGSGIAATDNGKGVINTPAFIGTVDYESGVITRTGGNVAAATISATYTPAAQAKKDLQVSQIIRELRPIDY